MDFRHRAWRDRVEYHLHLRRIRTHVGLGDPATGLMRRRDALAQAARKAVYLLLGAVPCAGGGWDNRRIYLPE